MWRKKQVLGGSAAVLLVAVLSVGCRLFEPEPNYKNWPPDTFVTSAPMEVIDGSIRVHVYWHGQDIDGSVEQFAIALLDADPSGDDDPANPPFNPARNRISMRLGEWTTRTDRIFEFPLEDADGPAIAKVLYVVAVDNLGKFDPTPACWRFASQEFEHPLISFRIRRGGDGLTAAFADSDTVGYGEPFVLSWEGWTPNAPEQEGLLAQLDTVAPLDGLYGYKYRLPARPCDESREDCWLPRAFNHALGESASYWGAVDSLRFANDNSGLDVLQQRLTSGIHRLLLVNTIDIAGMEVPIDRRDLNVVVNYDPETYLLRGQTDPVYTDDPHVYPFYRVTFPGGAIEEYTFAEGDTVPNRAYALFKALGRDDPRDLRLIPDYEVGFQAMFNALGLYNGVAPYTFMAPYGDAHVTPEWQPSEPGGWAADTVGCLVGPFRYTFRMRSQDEHQRPDGTADEFQFYGNHPPCVQCVELLNWEELSGVSIEDECYDQQCEAEVDSIFASLLPNPSYRLARNLGFGWLYYRLSTGEVWTENPLSLTDVDSAAGNYFSYRLALHGKDHPLEPPLAPEDRILSWSWDIVSENDPNNLVHDGPGFDDLFLPVFEYDTADPGSEIFVDEDGVWYLSVKFFVPIILHAQGPDAYLNMLLLEHGNAADAQAAFDLTTVMLGQTRVRAFARDASNCDARPELSGYHYFAGVRPRTGEHPISLPYPHWSCDPHPNDAGLLELEHFAFQSDMFSKYYQVKVLLNTGEVFP